MGTSNEDREAIRERAQDLGCSPARDPHCFFLALSFPEPHQERPTRKPGELRPMLSRESEQADKQAGFLLVPLHINSYHAPVQEQAEK